MKWFIASINLEQNKVERRDINIFLKKQFKNKRIKHYSEYYGNANLSIAENENDTPTIYHRGTLILIGDVRIDNRSELSANYNIDYESRSVEDELFILFLFQKYGDSIFTRLVGEFAFIIWDKSKNEIYSVRDHMGIKTLFWCQRGSEVWISSDIFLLQNVFNLNNLNEDYFKEFYLTKGSVDSTITPYKDVYRIPSANFLHVHISGKRLYKYWDLADYKDEIRYRNQQEYIEQFLNKIKDAVECRLVNHSKNAIMMSGGLDSTTIFAIGKTFETKNLFNTTVSGVCGVFEKYHECDERQYIKPVLEMYGEKEIYEVCDDYVLLKGFPNDSPWTFEPHVNSASYAFTKSIAQRARNEGCCNLLTGYAGDHVLSGSVALLPDLLRKMQFTKMLSNSYYFSKATRQSFLNTVFNMGILPLFGLGRLNKEYSREIVHKFKTFNQIDFYNQILHTKAHLFSDRVIGPIIGIDFRHPFLDRRLIEFMFKIPGELRWEKGVTKYLLRNAMENYLPKEVLSRENKTVHLPLTYHGIRECWSELYSILKEARIERLNLLSKADWNNELLKWRQGMNVREDFWILLTVELWLFRYNEILKK